MTHLAYPISILSPSKDALPHAPSPFVRLRVTLLLYPVSILGGSTEPCSRAQAEALAEGPVLSLPKGLAEPAEGPVEECDLSPRKTASQARATRVYEACCGSRHIGHKSGAP